MTVDDRSSVWGKFCLARNLVTRKVGDESIADHRWVLLNTFVPKRLHAPRAIRTLTVGRMDGQVRVTHTARTLAAG